MTDDLGTELSIIRIQIQSIQDRIKDYQRSKRFANKRIQELRDQIKVLKQRKRELIFGSLNKS